jgi:hypothetical protein
LFQSARWKAYLKNLQKEKAKSIPGDDESKAVDNIYKIMHSQLLWFTIEESNGHQKAAEAHLKRSDALMKDCTRKVNALEETLANTPKPSEVLDWDSFFL